MSETRRIKMVNFSELLRTQCLVEGRWIGEPQLPIRNPATGEQIAAVPCFGAAEAVLAVDAAHRALPAWSRLLAKQRAACLRSWFNLIIEHKEELAWIMTSEQGKPLGEARGEIEYAASYVEFYAEEAKRIYGETIPSHRTDARILVLRQPIGIVAAITPWNFPAAMITRKLAPALAAGCTVVCKPAGETPLTALALASLAERAGLPPGVLNMITGNSSQIGERWTADPRIRLISFTGSTRIGKLLMRQAAATVKKVDLELGGNAPFIVFEDADLEAAVEGALQSKFRNMGQTCVCPNRIYVQATVHDRFVERLAARLPGMVVGDGTHPGVTQGPLISESAVAKVEQHIADALARGARVIAGGKRHALGGTFFEPTLLANVDSTMLITQEETFGPLAPVYSFETEAEVIAAANDTCFGLAAYFYGRDIGRVFRVAEAIEAGMVGVNTGLISTELAPFGGVKESGLGREGSRRGLEEYVETKYVLLGGIN